MENEEKETLGSHMKELEASYTHGSEDGSGKVAVSVGKTPTAGKICIIRVDGRAFHTYTRPFTKRNPNDPLGPRTAFHSSIVGAMKHAMEALIDEFNPIMAYTQSDEITLLIGQDNVPFGGKCHKLNSIAASVATAAFNEYINFKAPRETIPDSRYPSRALFDARSYEASYEEAAATVLWRHLDCIKNSISTLARAYFTPKRLEGLRSEDRKRLLKEHRNVSWDDLPYGLKYGFFAHRAIKQFTLDELLAERKLPERAIKSIEANGGTVIRNYTKYEEFPPLNTIANLTDVIIHGHRPLLKENSDA